MWLCSFKLKKEAIIVSNWNDDNYYETASEESVEYYELLEAAKCILDSMTGVMDGVRTIAEVENIDIEASFGLINEVCELEINEIIPEADTFYLTLYVTTANNNSTEPIIYMYKIEDEFIERELIFASSTPPIKDCGRKVLDELIFVLKTLITH